MTKDQPKQLKDNDWWREPVLIFAKLSSYVAAPVLIALFLGQWLDQKYQTKPFLFLLLTGLAFAVSLIGIVKEALAYINKINQEIKDKNNQEKRNDSQ